MTLAGSGIAVVNGGWPDWNLAARGSSSVFETDDGWLVRGTERTDGAGFEVARAPRVAERRSTLRIVEFDGVQLSDDWWEVIRCSLLVENEFGDNEPFEVAFSTISGDDLLVHLVSRTLFVHPPTLDLAASGWALRTEPAVGIFRDIPTLYGFARVEVGQCGSGEFAPALVTVDPPAILAIDENGVPRRWSGGVVPETCASDLVRGLKLWQVDEETNSRAVFAQVSEDLDRVTFLRLVSADDSIKVTLFASTT